MYLESLYKKFCQHKNVNHIKFLFHTELSSKETTKLLLDLNMKIYITTVVPKIK